MSEVPEQPIAAFDVLWPTYKDDIDQSEISALYENRPLDDTPIIKVM